MNRRLALTASLLSLTAAGWAMEATPPGSTPATPAATTPVEAVIKPTVVPGEQSIALNVGDLKQVAKARFFVSRDEGKTWNMAQEILVEAANPQVPKFSFKPQADGLYHIVTVTVYRNGQSEAEPKNGSIPGKALALLVDATPPVVSTLDATPEPVTDPNATSAVVNVTWAITDANFATATLELSTDGGASFVATQAVAATGSAKLTVARTKDSTIQLRILAKDAAGNQAPSLAKTVTLPQPPDPEKALASAISALPTLAEIQPPPEETPAKPAEAAPADPAKSATAEHEPAVTPVAQPQPTVPTTTRRTTSAPDDVPFLNAAASAPLLEQARAKRDAGETDGALAIYLRLHESAVAPTAVAEEMAMLRSVGDHAAVARIGDDLRTELRTDVVRVEYAKALLLLGRPADATTSVSGVPKSSPRAREALLLLGKAQAALGKTAVATRIWDKLADGDDAVAEEARLQRGK